MRRTPMNMYIHTTFLLTLLTVSALGAHRRTMVMRLMTVIKKSLTVAAK